MYVELSHFWTTVCTESTGFTVTHMSDFILITTPANFSQLIHIQCQIMTILGSSLTIVKFQI
jgi:hypothetical protein